MATLQANISLTTFIAHIYIHGHK
uniref:Uncharacterized protein n=1 Tax=Arundo donax TaxID=35708 RepID=A0A0A9B388_ARUDO